jgi:hypothetical protein
VAGMLLTPAAALGQAGGCSFNGRILLANPPGPKIAHSTQFSGGVWNSHVSCRARDDANCAWEVVLVMYEFVIFYILFV